jgi:MFS family permease
MKASNNDVNHIQTEEPSMIKMVMFSTGYFLNTFLMIAFNNYVWTFYEGELGLISIVPLWPIYMAFANTLYIILSMLINPVIGYLTDKPFKWTKKRGFQSFIIAIIHALTIYDPIDVSHQFNALVGLRITQGLIPFIFCIMGALIFYKWFDLKGIKKQEVTRKLRELSL